MNELVNGYFLYYITDVSWRVFRGGGGSPPVGGRADFYYWTVIEEQQT